MQINSWQVLKFGGNSVSNLACWQTIATIIKKHLLQPTRILVVCSALGGISNKLEAILKAAVTSQHEDLLAEIILSHQKLATELGVDLRAHVGAELDDLQKLLTGISLLREISPGTHAKVMSFGEILLTKLGAAYLEKNCFPTTWCDARSLLISADEAHAHVQSQYLAAKCHYQTDPAVIKALNAVPTTVALTQGFIASNSQGETVLFGRGGSDTSAAYFAAKLAATRCEIWTDVPGIYTANPHQVPQAKLLKLLNYDEAQEIASMGAKVLHPHCIPPLKFNQIPLYVGYTRKPDRAGTEITANPPAVGPVSIKSIATKSPIALIQIETVQMWQQVGFLADIFQCFKKHGVSVDLISTSETTVTVTLDLKINSQDQKIIDAVLAELNSFGKATAVSSCAIVSIIGHPIRKVLHQLSDALKIFEEHKVYLVSQAANDLNLSFVVDEDQAPVLAQQLHSILIENNHAPLLFDQSWGEEFL